MSIIKRFFAGVVAVTAVISSVAFASEPDIGMSGVSAKNGRISINITNNTEEDMLLTVTLEKQDENLQDILRFYGIRQKNLGAGQTMEFGFEIPDDREGVPGSGDYIISAQNRKDVSERQMVLIDYADSNEIESYMKELKQAVETVTTEEPYEKILPILESDDSKGVFFSIGADYEAFRSLDKSVKQQVANLIYYNADTTLVTDKFAEEFIGLFSLGVYNSGDKEEGIKLLNPTYNGAAADEKLLGSVASIMDKSYSNNEEFIEGFKLAYGLETINRSKMNTIEDVLDVFVDETGACENEINKIMKLSEGSRDKAYEYIVKTVSKNKVTTEFELDTLLKGGYNVAKSSGSTGGGGGGGSIGSVANKSENKQTSMSSAIGSGTVDTKVEEVKIFTDLTTDHWAAESVSALKAKGVVNGNESGAFEPDRAVTREEFTKMLVAVCGFGLNSSVDFADIDVNAWYAPYIGAAVENGIVKGIGDNLFGIGATITRQDMAVMAKRTMNAMNIVIESGREYNGFTDEDMIADYAKAAVKELYEEKVINGKEDNLFDPTGQATRAEAAKIIYEVMKGGM